MNLIILGIAGFILVWEIIYILLHRAYCSEHHWFESKVISLGITGVTFPIIMIVCFVSKRMYDYNGIKVLLIPLGIGAFLLINWGIAYLIEYGLPKNNKKVRSGKYG